MFQPIVQSAPAAALHALYRPDAALTADEDARLRRLLFACFSHEAAFLGRRFLRFCPAHRWLVFDPAGELIAHLAAHEKIIGTSAGDLKIGGIAEVCVAARYRGRGLVRHLLNAAHDWLRERDFPFALLFGQPHVYASSGYVLTGNEIVSTNSLARHWNPFCGKPMVRSLSAQPWPKGTIDLRGPTF